MHYQEQERARNMARLGALAGAANQREMSSEERAEYERRERLGAMQGMAQHSFNTVMMYGDELDVLELQKALKVIVLRIIARQPG